MEKGKSFSFLFKVGYFGFATSNNDFFLFLLTSSLVKIKQVNHVCTAIIHRPEKEMNMGGFLLTLRTRVLVLFSWLFTSYANVT